VGIRDLLIPTEPDGSVRVHQRKLGSVLNARLSITKTAVAENCPKGSCEVCIRGPPVINGF